MLSTRSLTIADFLGQSAAHAATTLSLITFERSRALPAQGSPDPSPILPVLKGCKDERGSDRAVSICPDRRGYDTSPGACDWIGTEKLPILSQQQCI
ncbi:uncharacterized protein BDW70DRAFT_143191 [Aspergillus foveolatus]|uniref:uncharacterized protein n=1 Tax=Aspergillus foveolatus TaxID=210207 RepID=UPI003CCD4D89